MSVKCEVSCEPSPDGLRYLWRDADYTGIANYFNTVNWLNMLTTNLTPDSLWGAFTDTLNRAIQNCVPAIPVRNKQSRRTQNKTTYPKTYVMQCLGNTVYENVTAKTHLILTSF